MTAKGKRLGAYPWITAASMNADWIRGEDMNDNCKNCKYWKFENGRGMDDGGNGLCRRYPPTLDPNYAEVDPEGITESSVWWAFAITNEGDWCGEYAKNE